MDAFKSSIENSKSLFDSFFLPFIKSHFKSYLNSRVAEASIYSLEAGGKRIRPIIAINSYYSGSEILPHSKFDLIQNNLLILSAAIECIHTYSLIHDDLPAMDDDDLRRGLPTCHKKYDVPTAILAGDALNSFGFYLISQLNADSSVLIDCISYLHEGAGFPGMISGQMEDLEAEGKATQRANYSSISDEDRLKSIHSKKTGALIMASFLLGNRLREDYLERIANIQSYAEAIGLLFQITDDILDVEGNKDTIGKTPGKDRSTGKLTFPGHFGLAQSKIIRDETRDKAIFFANSLDKNKNSFFLGFPKYIAERKN
jgi:geranylgeranyl diphosphate synthase type II